MAPAVQQLALSFKQPWATLIVHGCKSIEVRSWPTSRRMRIFVHASQIPDAREEAWQWLTPDLLRHAEFRGGLVGSVEITGCIAYSDRRAFAADRMLHLNKVAWFRRPVTYGFVLSNPKPAKFQPFIGNIKFFPVPTASR